MKKTFLILLTIMIALAIWVKLKEKNNQLDLNSITLETVLEVADFIKEGNLAGSNEEDWSLVYEEPGKPALKVGLVFNEKSACNKDGVNQTCVDFGLVGDRITVEGINKDNKVTVLKLTNMNGLKIETLKQGAGDEAKNGDTVSVHYVGALEDGTKFDSSVDRGQPYSFLLGAGQVIQGWDLGVLGMKVGEKRKLTIPYGLAYGEAGYGSIPAKATLIFEVELLGINK